MFILFAYPIPLGSCTVTPESGITSGHDVNGVLAVCDP